MPSIRQAAFALRVVTRKGGPAAIIYRRRPDGEGRNRLQRVAALAPLAYTAGGPLLREAVRAGGRPLGNGSGALQPGRFYPLDSDWGARLACFALLAAGLRDPERLLRAAQHVRAADANEAAWWVGLIEGTGNSRALRALRILTEAVA